jgi:hypothetical protein
LPLPNARTKKGAYLARRSPVISLASFYHPIYNNLCKLLASVFSVFDRKDGYVMVLQPIVRNGTSANKQRTGKEHSATKTEKSLTQKYLSPAGRV